MPPCLCSVFLAAEPPHESSISQSRQAAGADNRRDTAVVALVLQGQRDDSEGKVSNMFRIDKRGDIDNRRRGGWMRLVGRWFGCTSRRRETEELVGGERFAQPVQPDNDQRDS